MRSLRLSAGVGSWVRSNSAIEAGKYRLDKRIMQYLHNRLPGRSARTREFTCEVDHGCDLLGAGILEET